ncbi:hypothetical protein C4901_14710 [Acidiferrobacter sp. SPIII_3]|uniref:CCE_0567 family metalloprotein n=1 Tax=Acidiferrobacter sp. SPIII_3 TaxID=1281578 RepID=UPI000D72AE83|nr:CCE_0567 family metalloprotein [Acidiferrobacter sp. SPIII_3]AWP25066.1 hypothetical protein C4901_14710 [Acidiferrobacter sp. SPIII_3]
MSEGSTSDAIESLKKRIKKLSAQAIEHKMRLHDLAEDLPVGWETIRDVATETHEAYRALAAARAELAGVGGERD